MTISDIDDGTQRPSSSLGQPSSTRGIEALVRAGVSTSSGIGGETPPKSKKKAAGTKTEMAYGGLSAAVKLLKECADGVPVPGLKGALGGLVEIMRVYEVG